MPLRHVRLFLLLTTTLSMTRAEATADSYLQWMQDHLPEVPVWTEWQQRTGATPPDFERLPRQNRLPDPLRFLDGRTVGSPADWAERCREILQLLERYMIGSLPAKPALEQAIVVQETQGEGYRVRDVRLEFGGARRSSVRVQVTLPDAPGPLPALITPGLSGWAPRLVRRGYVSVGYAGSDRADDADALAALYPEHDFSLLARRAWLVPVVVDYVETLPEVNARQIAMYGYSRDGKMAAIASALEPRLAALMAGSTGVGGFLPWRLSGERGGGESIESTTRMFPNWFAPQLRFFSGREDRLPVDGNLLLALSAPRPVLVEYGLNDEVSNVWGVEQSVESARRVYRLLGNEREPSLLRSPGFHGGIDPEACLDWLDAIFGRSTRPWRNDRLHDWSFDAWKAGRGAPVDLPAEARRGNSLPSDASRARVTAAVRWLLGDAPPRLPTTGRAAPPPPFPPRPLPPGPTAVAQGTYGNPGQLAPDVPAWVISRGGQEFGWLAPQKDRVDSRRVRFGSNLEGHLYYPAGTAPDAKLPTVLWLHGYHDPLGYMWVYRRDLHPILALVDAGYAVFAYDQAGFGMRAAETRTFYDRYPSWSMLGRMVEDARAAIDALEEDRLVDASRISVFGYTLGGLVGLTTAALDPRVTEVVSICGFTPFRTDRSDHGLTGLERYYRDRPLLPRLGWLVEQGRELPYDFEDLLALVAPRRVLVVQPQRDRDADPAGVRASVQRAQAAFAVPGPTSALELYEPDDYARLTQETQSRIIGWMRGNL